MIEFLNQIINFIDQISHFIEMSVASVANFVAYGYQTFMLLGNISGYMPSFLQVFLMGSVCALLIRMVLNFL